LLLHLRSLEMNAYFNTYHGYTKAHPYSICDRIADAFVKRMLIKDPLCYVAIRVFMKETTFYICGEMDGCMVAHFIDAQELVLDILRDAQYDVFYPDIFYKLNVSTHITTTTSTSEYQEDETDFENNPNNPNNKPEPCPILEDHGNVYGYSDITQVNDTLTHLLVLQAEKVFLENSIPYIYPTMHIQCSNSKITVSVEIHQNHTQKHVQLDILKYIVFPVLNSIAHVVDTSHYKMHILQSPHVLSKTYHSGHIHPFAGIHPFHSMRCGTLMAQKMAKWVTSKGYARRCAIQIHVINEIQGDTPLVFCMDTFGTETKPVAEVQDMLHRQFSPLTLETIIVRFDLANPLAL
jgi:S-adenosylmethionine synthetase